MKRPPELLLVPTRLEAAGLFPGLAPPPDAEGVEVEIEGRRMRLVLGGFGLAAAGARAAAAIARHDPVRIVLAGIAGSFDPQGAPEGALVVASALGVDGIGAGEGPDFLAAAAMGFGELPGRAPGSPVLSSPALPGARRGMILSVAAASGGPAMAARRRAAHPDALAEDMESWAVGLAAEDAGRPLVVLRAISNLAGDRDPARWRVAEALARLREGLAALPSPG